MDGVRPRTGAFDRVRPQALPTDSVHGPGPCGRTPSTATGSEGVGVTTLEPLYFIFGPYTIYEEKQR